MNRQFGALSGLAIVLVVLNHSIHMVTTIPPALGYPPAQGWPHYLLLALEQLGIFAVPTFLFISGGFAVYYAQSSTLRQGYKAVWSRMQRILWPYLIWSVAFYILIYVQLGQRHTLLEYVKDLLVGYPFNFVPLLVFFLALSPLLVRIAKRHGFLLVAGIGLYQLLLIDLANPMTLRVALPGWMQAFVPRVVGTTLADWAIFFPLGIVYGLNARRISAGLSRAIVPLAITVAALFALHLLDQAGAIQFPLAKYLAPLAFVALIPSIKRDAIPLAPWWEWVGAMSYGLYLTNLIAADVVLWAVQVWLPSAFYHPLLLAPVVFALALAIPLALMRGLSRLPARAAYRYVFG